MNDVLLIAVSVLSVALLFIRLLQQKRHNDLSEWAIAHSSLSGFFIFILMAGEISTTFALLGSTGFLYGAGGSAFYSITMSIILGAELYFIQPLIWQRSKELGAISQTEYYSRAFHSPLLGKIVTIVAALALIPYIAIQISGLAIIASELTHGTLSPTMARLWGMLGIIAYSILGGIRGVARLSLVKDALLLIIIMVVGLYLPLHLYGSWPQILHQIEHRFPRFTTLHAPGYGYTWFITTTAITCIGYTFWPHLFSSIFAAKGPQALRKSQIISPIYTFLLFPITMVGFTAKLNNPHLSVSQRDYALLDLALDHLPPMMITIIALGGILTALIPSSVMTISLAMNLVKTFSRYNRIPENTNSPSSTDTNFAITENQQKIMVKSLVILISIFAASFSAYGGKSIQGLLVAGYGIISQLSIPFIIDIWQQRYPAHRRIPVAAIICGLVAGVVFATVASTLKINYAWLRHYLPDPIAQLNTGIAALIINIFIVCICTQISRKKDIYYKIPHTSNTG